MTWVVRPEVEQVVADLLRWRRLGVVVLTVDPRPQPQRGVRIGVHRLHPLVTQAMRARYRFPVECVETPMTGGEAAGPAVSSGTS